MQKELTKYPSLQNFIFELQKEEKVFREKLFQSVTYGGILYKKTSKKRKGNNISPTPTKLLPTTTSENSNNHNHVSNPFKQFKLNDNNENKILPSTTSPLKKNEKILISLREKPHDPNQYIKIPWIQWKYNSCRVDAFATLAYFVFFNEHGESIFPKIEGPHLPDEIHPLGVLLKSINESLTLPMV